MRRSTRPGGRPRRMFAFTYWAWASSQEPGVRVDAMSRPPRRVIARARRRNPRVAAKSPHIPKLFPNNTSVSKELRGKSIRWASCTCASRTPRRRAHSTASGETSVAVTASPLRSRYSATRPGPHLMSSARPRAHRIARRSWSSHVRYPANRTSTLEDSRNPSSRSKMNWPDSPVR